jgi:hypothetical protein
MMVEGKPEKGVKDQVEVPEVINDPKHYGMHRHFTAAGSVLLFGDQGWLNRVDYRFCFARDSPPDKRPYAIFHNDEQAVEPVC